MFNICQVEGRQYAMCIRSVCLSSVLFSFFFFEKEHLVQIRELEDAAIRFSTGDEVNSLYTYIHIFIYLYA